MLDDGTWWIRGALPPELAASISAALAGAKLADGRATATGKSTRDIKNNRQLTVADPLGKKLSDQVIGVLSQREDFKGAALPRTMLPLLFAAYEPGMAYGEHLDLPVMGTATGPMRTDLSLTIFLTPPSEYDGGELVLRTTAGERRLKGNAGDAFLYPSDTLHQVAPVTRGTRRVAVTWIQSMVRDPEERSILIALGHALAAVTASGAPEAEVLRLRAVQHRLLRRWAVC